MINLTIDGVQIEAKEGQSILSAAREHGIQHKSKSGHEHYNRQPSCYRIQKEHSPSLDG